MIMFAATKVAKFSHKNLSLRYGQAFHQYMKLEKVTNVEDKRFCDRIYNEISEEKVKAMITSRIDKAG